MPPGDEEPGWFWAKPMSDFLGGFGLALWALVSPLREPGLLTSSNKRAAFALLWGRAAMVLLRESSKAKVRVGSCIDELCAKFKFGIKEFL